MYWTAQYKRFVAFNQTLLVLMLALFICLSSCKKQNQPPAQPASQENLEFVEQLAVEPDSRQKEPNRLTEPVKQITEPNQPVAEPNLPPGAAVPVPIKWSHPRSDERAPERRRMVDLIRDLYRLTDPKVLRAVQNVPRHWFVTPQEQRLAYADMPLPIGHGQTISQPFIVAYMTNLLNLNQDKKVLEVGTGSGYQAAVLTEYTPHVYTIEIVEPLARTAANQLKKRGYETVKTKTADGYWGWKDQAPFDAIIVTCAADHIPPALIEQLKPTGKMCIPVGGPLQIQNLMLISKDKNGKITSQSLMPVRFVPLVRKIKFMELSPPNYH